MNHPATETRTERTTRSPLVAKDLASLKLGLVELVPELRGRACRLAGDPTTAEDIVQDTIERALKFAVQNERGTNLRAWVYQILFSVFITRYRRTRREKNALRSLASDPCAWTTPERFAPPEAGASLSPTTKGKLSMRLLDGDDASRLEHAIDDAEKELPPLKSFVLPGGSAQAAALHLARTVCRRAERAVLAIDDAAARTEVVIYLNRLSDLLFTLARHANLKAGVEDVPWAPRAAKKT